MLLASQVFAVVCVLLCFSLLRCVEAATNVTVDDQYGDEVTGALPTYSPASSWVLGTICSDCLARPDPSQAYGGTWHESTRRLGNTTFTIEIGFTGTAVYAYFILPNYTQGISVKTDISFMLDWATVGAFEYDSGTNSSFVYNALGYSATNLSNTAHTFVINSVVDGPNASTILFDRLVYTVEDNSTTSNSAVLTRSSTISYTELSQGTSSSGYGLPTLSAPQSTNTSTSTSSHSTPAPTSSSDKLPQTAIIGGSVAGGLAIIFAAAIALCIRRRRRHAAIHSLRYTPTSKAKMPESTDRGSIDERGMISIRQSISNLFTGARRTDSLSVLPFSFVVGRPNEEDTRPEELPQLEKDPFQRDIFDEKQERLAARSRSRSSPGDRAASSPWNSSPRSGRSTRTERMLLEYIAGLQAEVDRLQDRHSAADVSPPPSYGDAGGRLV